MNVLKRFLKFDVPRFSECLQQFKLNYNLICSEYSKGLRFYHNINHVIETLKCFYEYEHDSWPESITIILALLFHDIIYNPSRDDNELKSCEFFFENCNCSNDLKYEVARVIMATAHKNPCVSEPEQLISDIDLRVLAERNVFYKDYTIAIRKEYYMYSDVEFAVGRSKFIRNLLQQDCIYYKFKWLEQDARQNLLQELKLIESRK